MPSFPRRRFLAHLKQSGGDLNLKKSWHTGTLKNIGRVWKKEQDAKAEQAKLAELQKEMAQERAVEELQRLQERAGLKVRSQKLDWMYSVGPGQAPSLREAETEAFLLGKKKVDSLLEAGEKKVLSTTSEFNPISLVNSKANSKRDIQAKVREDPLLAIRRQEQASIETIISNPLKMREIEREKERRRKEKKEKKRRREEEMGEKRSRRRKTMPVFRIRFGRRRSGGEEL
ncbi:MAG: Pre-mRNA splicing factor-domain-containing protein [Olpidium bornovanus]|uniref:Pre-mRNA splicing factor-domain-containing protein n=1 Tax=Olpidium bornovanus TaxID=278681 RepID=A0A8H7ZQC8_9FUNG|nr:MAG: Pre-mRNA splicing factor-domain-containing protein [Olpidium bornovanus]